MPRFKKHVFRDILNKYYGAGSVIISAEHFSWLDSEGEIYKLKDVVEQIFSEVKIVFYLRRQDRQAISHKQEGAKSKLKEQPAGVVHGHDASALPEINEHNSLYLNYYEKMSLWSGVFGKENIQARIFDKEKMKNGDIIQDFISLMGIAPPIQPKRPRSNKSMGRRKLIFLQSLWRCGVSPELSQKLKKNYPDRRDGRLLPGKEEAISFYQKFKPSNVMLAKEYFGCSGDVFDHSFEGYPDIGNEKV